MKQYLKLLKDIQEDGTYKAAARENMPGTKSLFGAQLRFDLQEGFPLLTTKKMFWKGVVVELLWFLRGDTNIKYLVDNGVNIWNEDAYNYYLKQCKDIQLLPNYKGQKLYQKYTFEEFVDTIKSYDENTLKVISKDIPIESSYTLGDCGFQYGKVWREWEGGLNFNKKNEDDEDWIKIDQIKNVIESIKNNPTSRRHIVTAIDPSNDSDLALYWCHAMFQFNCRPLTYDERLSQYMRGNNTYNPTNEEIAISAGKNKGIEGEMEHMDLAGVPKYYLDCQLYQRSADVFLGVPFNIASYALLTEMIAKICNMVPGEYIHTFGDVHIYDNHKDAVKEQLSREPSELPKLKLNNDMIPPLKEGQEVELYFEDFEMSDFKIEGYSPQPAIKAELSTGMKK